MPESIVKSVANLGSSINKKRKDVTSELANAGKNVVDYTITNPIKQTGKGIKDNAIDPLIGDPVQKLLKDSPVDSPVVLPPTRMPTNSDKAKASRASIREQLRRRGRASTILTETDKLGA